MGYIVCEGSLVIHTGMWVTLFLGNSYRDVGYIVCEGSLVIHTGMWVTLCVRDPW